MRIQQLQQLHRPGARAELRLFERVARDGLGFQLGILPVRAWIGIQLRIVWLELQFRLFERRLDLRLLRRSLGLLVRVKLRHCLELRILDRLIWRRLGIIKRFGVVERLGLLERLGLIERLGV